MVYQRTQLERKILGPSISLRVIENIQQKMDLFPKTARFTFKSNKKVPVDPKSIYFAAHVHPSKTKKTRRSKTFLGH